MTLNFVIENWYFVFTSIVAIILLLFYLRLSKVLEDAKAYAIRLKFYHIRDDLRMHVALGNIKENSEIFKHYDSFVNVIVRRAEKLTIIELAKAIRKYGLELSPDEKAKRELIKSNLKRSPKEIQDLVVSFYCELAELLYKQSRATYYSAYVALLFVSFFKWMGVGITSSFGAIGRLSGIAILRRQSVEMAHSLAH